MREEEIAALTLRKIAPEAVLKNIIERCGTLKGLLGANFEDLVAAGFDLKTAGQITEASAKEAENNLKKLHNMNGRLILLEDDDYPVLLKQIFDPPVCLYVLGDASCLQNLCIAMVGARKASRIGEDMAGKLAGELGAAGVTVISGFAYGIDIASHLGALKAGGKTAAVLGGGLAEIYPAGHKKYMNAICADGCIMTEFDMHEAALPAYFPKRNRIVSGMSRGVVVVEASPRSGSLITCRLALEQNRDVFAVPASPLFANNATNKLIKEGAMLTETAADVLNQYRNVEEFIEDERRFDNVEQQAVYDALSLEPLSIDEIIFRTGVKYAELMGILMNMELTDAIEKGFDGRYIIKYKGAIR